MSAKNYVDEVLEVIDKRIGVCSAELQQLDTIKKAVINLSYLISSKEISLISEEKSAPDSLSNRNSKEALSSAIKDKLPTSKEAFFEIEKRLEGMSSTFIFREKFKIIPVGTVIPRIDFVNVVKYHGGKTANTESNISYNITRLIKSGCLERTCYGFYKKLKNEGRKIHRSEILNSLKEIVSASTPGDHLIQKGLVKRFKRDSSIKTRGIESSLSLALRKLKANGVICEVSRGVYKIV